MFVGHLAAGLAARRYGPRASLGTYVLAAVFVDALVWAFVVAGVEHVAIRPGITATNPMDLYDYPWSHSLAMDVVWAGLCGGAYFLARRHRRESWLVFAAVLSHWLLDFIAHRPDMPLAPGVQRYLGLGLYDSRAGMLVVEGAMWLAGVALYARATRAGKRAGAYVFWVGVAVLTLAWIASMGGAPPPGTTGIIQIGITSLIFVAVVVAWAYWVDRLRAGGPRGYVPAAASVEDA